jgi:uncharacterized membrane protein HdeD (DUF308 family)
VRALANGVAVSAWCGVLMAASGAVALAMPLADPNSSDIVAGSTIFAGGIAELVLGRHGAQVERARTEVGLGLLSLATASILFLRRETDALSFTALLSVWLVARGVTELAGGLAAAGQQVAGVAAARLVRGWTDLILGLVATIGSLAAAFPLYLLAWPTAIVRTVMLFVAVSLIASACLHVWLALAWARR